MKCKRRKAVLATRAAVCRSRKARAWFAIMLANEAGLRRASYRRLVMSYAARHVHHLIWLANDTWRKDLRAKLRRERDRWLRLINKEG